jgi:hypothetical protein
MNKRLFENALDGMYEALWDYAEAHKRTYGSPIGDDGVLGDDWIAAVRALAGLLNGETGQIDCGAFDRKLRDLAELNGFTRDFEDLPPQPQKSIAPEIDKSVDNAIDNMKLGLKPDWE